jgi:hypothetical protein
LMIDWLGHVSVHSRFETTLPIIVACADRTAHLSHTEGLHLTRLGGIVESQAGVLQEGLPLPSRTLN